MIRRIYTYPEEVLTRVADPVSNIDGELVETARDMAETMYAAPGVGLAAPQIGLSERVIVLDCDSEEEKKEGKGRGLLKLINPEIIEREGQIVWEEGCLSVVDFTAEVNRAARVLVRAWTPEEKEIRLEADNLLAVAIQHEIDHLDGKLFIDRISRLKRDMYRRKLRKLEREGRLDEVRDNDRSKHI